MLDTSFIYVDRQLVPDEIHEPNYMPPLLKERFRDLLFGGLLFECEPASSTTGPFFIYEVGLACDARIAVLCLPEREDFVLIGPYLPDAASTSSLEELLTDAGIPLSQKSAYSTYLNTLPVLDHSRLYVVFSALVSSAYQKDLEHTFRGFDISPEHPAPCPVFEEDTLQLRAETLEKRYADEQKLLNLVIKGDLDAVYSLGVKNFSLERVPNKLRNEKNLMIIITTLIISKKPVNTGKSRDRDTEFTTKLLLLEKASTRLLLPVKCLPPGRHIRLKLNTTPQKRRSLIPLWEKRTPLFLRPNSERRRRHVFHIRRRPRL